MMLGIILSDLQKPFDSCRVDLGSIEKGMVSVPLFLLYTYV